MASPVPSSSSKGKAPILCQAATSFKKKPGSLVLSRSQLAWENSSSNKEAELTFDVRRLNSLFMSKEGGAKVVLKVGVLDIIGGTNEDSYNFTFTSGPSAVSDREHFKREISTMIARNRAQASSNAAAQAAAAAPGPSTASSAAPSPSAGGSGGASDAFNGLPSPAQVAAQASSVLANGRASPAPGSSATPAPAAGPTDPTKDWTLRQRLLKTNPELLNLHIELVRTGQITEEEFWEGREYLLLAESVAVSQKQGRNAIIVDPRPEQGENGETKIKLSQQLIKDIFEQYPIVAKVYNDNVPEPLAEAEFWHRYFHSKLFDRHRTSGRSNLGTGSSSGIEDDIIFDRYLDDEDDDLEPKNLPAHAVENVYRLLDLAATEEDHGETGNAKDYTMRAGGQRKSLPLMRRFNEHSERLLTQALGAQEARTTIDGGDAGARKYYDDIILEDLQGGQTDTFIPLDVRDRENMYEGMGSAGTTTSDKENDGANLDGVGGSRKRRRLDVDEEQAVWEESEQSLADWQPDLGRGFHFSRSSARQALRSLHAHNTARHSGSSGASSSKQQFPETVLRSMLSCQASANEFLRHFWSAILPSNPSDFGYSAASMAAPAQKAAKAVRMMGYLEKTQERVDTIVQQSQIVPGTDAVAVREALEPCLMAVRKAMAFYKAKLGKI